MCITHGNSNYLFEDSNSPGISIKQCALLMEIQTTSLRIAIVPKSSTKIRKFYILVQKLALASGK